MSSLQTRKQNLMKDPAWNELKRPSALRLVLSSTTTSTATPASIDAQSSAATPDQPSSILILQATSSASGPSRSTPEPPSNSGDAPFSGSCTFCLEEDPPTPDKIASMARDVLPAASSSLPGRRMPHITTKGWTLEGLVAKGMRPVPRFNASASQKVLRAKIDEFDKTGVPLVIEGWDEKGTWDAGLFTPEWLMENHPQQTINVRNVHDRSERGMSLRDFRWRAEDAAPYASPGEEGRYYWKDAECPEEWREWVEERNILPSALLRHGETDHLHYLPSEGRVETLMCYLGIGDTFTPCHKDLCASSGQNLMCYAERGGSSFWFMTTSSDAPAVSAYFHELGQEIDLETHVLTVEELAKAPFPVYVTEQKVGDLVLVPPRSCHQVVNNGGLTIKTSWSRMTLDGLATALYHELHIYRRVCRPETYRVKATIFSSLEHHAQKMKERRGKPDRHLLETLCQLIGMADNILAEECAGNYDTLSLLGDGSTQYICDYCNADIFSSLFQCTKCVSQEGGSEQATHICPGCYIEGRTCKCGIMEASRSRDFDKLLDVRNSARALLPGIDRAALAENLTERSLLDTRSEAQRLLLFEAGATYLNIARSTLDEKRRCSGSRNKKKLDQHRVPAFGLVTCRQGCHSSTCFKHALGQYGMHAAEIIIERGTMSDVKDASPWHKIHQAAKKRSTHGAREAEKTGTFSDPQMQIMLYAQRYPGSPPMNDLVKSGWYDPVGLAEEEKIPAKQALSTTTLQAHDRVVGFGSANVTASSTKSTSKRARKATNRRASQAHPIFVFDEESSRSDVDMRLSPTDIVDLEAENISITAELNPHQGPASPSFWDIGSPLPSSPPSLHFLSSELGETSDAPLSKKIVEQKLGTAQRQLPGREVYVVVPAMSEADKAKHVQLDVPMEIEIESSDDNDNDEDYQPSKPTRRRLPQKRSRKIVMTSDDEEESEKETPSLAASKSPSPPSLLSSSSGVPPKRKRQHEMSATSTSTSTSTPDPTPTPTSIPTPSSITIAREAAIQPGSSSKKRKAVQDSGERAAAGPRPPRPKKQPHMFFPGPKPAATSTKSQVPSSAPKELADPSPSSLPEKRPGDSIEQDRDATVKRLRRDPDDSPPTPPLTPPKGVDAVHVAPLLPETSDLVGVFNIAIANNSIDPPSPQSGVSEPIAKPRTRSSVKATTPAKPPFPNFTRGKTSRFAASTTLESSPGQDDAQRSSTSVASKASESFPPQRAPWQSDTTTASPTASWTTRQSLRHSDAGGSSGLPHPQRTTPESQHSVAPEIPEPPRALPLQATSTDRPAYWPPTQQPAIPSGNKPTDWLQNRAWPSSSGTPVPAPASAVQLARRSSLEAASSKMSPPTPTGSTPLSLGSANLLEIRSSEDIDTRLKRQVMEEVSKLHANIFGGGFFAGHSAPNERSPNHEWWQFFEWKAEVHRKEVADLRAEMEKHKRSIEKYKHERKRQMQEQKQVISGRDATIDSLRKENERLRRNQKEREPTEIVTSPRSATAPTMPSGQTVINNIYNQEGTPPNKTMTMPGYSHNQPPMEYNERREHESIAPQHGPTYEQAAESHRRVRSWQRPQPARAGVRYFHDRQRNVGGARPPSPYRSSSHVSTSYPSSSHTAIEEYDPRHNAPNRGEYSGNGERDSGWS